MHAQTPDLLDPMRALAGQHTQARLFLGGGEASYATATALRLRADHAAAIDSVSEGWPDTMSGVSLQLASQAPDRSTYLRRPDLGRRLTEASRQALEAARRPADLQVVIGDGLSPGAAVRLGLPLASNLRQLAEEQGLTVAPLISVCQARVGVLNDIGPRVDADLVVLLIGERPGLAVAEALSAYLAWRPGPGATDADRNLISNVHRRGVTLDAAAPRILGLSQQLRHARRSGVAVKENAVSQGDRRGPAIAAQLEPGPGHGGSSAADQAPR